MRTIAHLSDFHFGTERAELAAALRAELAANPPSLVVVSGDLTQRARGAQFEAAAAFLRALPSPQLIVPGNHDVPLFDLLRRFLAPLERYRTSLGEVLDPVFDDGEICVIGLNTARSLTWKSGRISLAQIEWLQEQLAATSAPFKVVVTHHPFVPPPSDDTGEHAIKLVGRAARAMHVLDRGGVDLLLAGHLHHGYSGDTRARYPAARRAIVAAQAGTAISGRVRRDPNGYNRIALGANRLSIEVRTWRDGAFTSLRTTNYRRGPDGWQPVERGKGR